jgi:hypothetical protein
MPDSWESQYDLDPEDNSDAALDSDNDGLTNLEEYKKGTNPLSEDSDGDNYSDKIEVDNGSNPNSKLDYPKNIDSDGDGIKDGKEKECGLDPFKDDATEDNDEDGLTNYEECVKYRSYRLNVNKADTDGDKYSDKVEIDKGTDPSDSTSIPKSHFLNIVLFIFGIGFVIGGIVLFSKDTTTKIKPVKATSKPMVDFTQAKKEMQKPVQQKPKQQAARPQPLHYSELDNRLRKKREMLKLKKMRSIFDEFAEDKPIIESPLLTHPVYKKLEDLPKKTRSKEKLFERLDELSDEDAFEELEIISRKDKKIKESRRLSKEEQEKLDKLSRRVKK